MNTFDLARQTHRVFVYAFMVSTFHSGSQRNRGFSEAIAQFVGGRQGSRPALLRLRIEQVELALLVVEAGGVYPQQPDFGAKLPIVPEKPADFCKDLIV